MSHIHVLAPFFDGIKWEQAWEMLQKMAGNPECIEIIIVSFFFIKNLNNNFLALLTQSFFTNGRINSKH